MDKLTAMAVFARVVEAQSFTGAAAQLGMSPLAVSKARGSRLVSARGGSTAPRAGRR